MRKLRHSSALLGLVLLVLGGAGQVRAQIFGPVSALNSNAAIDSGGDFRPQLASDGNGTWVAVWDSDDSLGGTIGTDSDIHFTRSTDGGVTWTAAAPLNSNAASDSGTDVRPQIATDRAGTWVAVWDSTDTLGGTLGTDADILFVRSTDGGATWSAPAALNTNAGSDTGNDIAPQIATDGAGTWVAVWSSTDTLGLTIGPDPDILVARSTDGGATWSAPVALNTDAATDSAIDEFPRLATDGTSWVAVWTTYGGVFGSDRDVVEAHSTDGGLSWSAPAVLSGSEPSSDDSFPAVATDGLGNWVAAWTSSGSLGGTLGADSDILFARSTDGGATWSAPAPLNADAATDTGIDAFAGLAADGLGSWLAVWQSTDKLGGALGFDFDQDILLARSTDGGATWSTPVPLDNGAFGDTGTDFVAQVASDHAGRWIAAWSDVGRLGGSDVDVLTVRGVPCPPLPQGGCIALTGKGKAKLRLVQGTEDRLAWSWSTPTPPPGFGNPVITDSYTLCVYDQGGTDLLLGAEAPAGGTCSGQPCWIGAGGGYKYTDSRDRTPNGLKDMRLRGGAGSTKLSLHGRGANLPVPFAPLLPLGLPARVQLRSTTGTCWDATFLATGVKRATSTEFRGVAVP